MDLFYLWLFFFVNYSPSSGRLLLCKCAKINRIQWYFVTKIVLIYGEKKTFSSDREKLLKFEVKG